MEETPGDQTMMNRWRQGDQKAANELYERYVSRLVSLAQRRLSKRLSSRLDAEDIVQSAFRSFFVRARDGQFEVKDPDDLWKLLARITIHKTLKQVDFHSRGKRNAFQEVGKSEDDQQLLVNFLSDEPTPDAAAIFVDELQHFLEQMREEDREIVSLRLDGYSNTEIAEKLDISDRKIRRLMERMRGLAEKEAPLFGEA